LKLESKFQGFLFLFFFPIFWYSQIGDYQQEDLSKFRYMPYVKIEICNNHFTFWQLTRTCCKNLVI
jgi:hypothetical protein